MTIDRLRKAVRAQPFQPFIIRTADGRGYRVRHPEMMLLSPRAERTFVVYDESSNDPEDYVVLDAILVSAIDFTHTDPSNGSSQPPSQS